MTTESEALLFIYSELGEMMTHLNIGRYELATSNINAIMDTVAWLSDVYEYGREE